MILNYQLSFNIFTIGTVSELIVLSSMLYSDNEDSSKYRQVGEDVQWSKDVPPHLTSSKKHLTLTNFWYV